MQYTIKWQETILNDQEEIEERINSLPNAKIITKENMDNCTEVLCSDTFEANSTEDAKQIVKDQYYEVQVFDCEDEDGKRVFTEEDL